MNRFEQWENCLSNELAEQLYDTYVENTPPITWTHRGTGRFTFDLTTMPIGQTILNELITRENSPWYQDTAFENDCAIWLQCFIHGGFLASHREKCKGVSTIYLNKQQHSGTSGFIRWFENPEPNEMWNDDEPVHISYPEFNCGNWWKPADDVAVFNPWHYVHRNNDPWPRFSLQIFRAELISDKGQAINSMEMIQQGKLQIYRETTALEHYSEDNDVFGYGIWDPEILSTWAKNNAQIIEQMTA